MQLATFVFLIGAEWSRAEQKRAEMLKRILKHRIKSHFEMSLSRLQMIRFGCFCMDISLLYGRFVIWHHISLHHFSVVFYLKQKHNHFSAVTFSLFAWMCIGAISQMWTLISHKVVGISLRFVRILTYGCAIKRNSKHFPIICFQSKQQQQQKWTINWTNQINEIV